VRARLAVATLVVASALLVGPAGAAASATIYFRSASTAVTTTSGGSSSLNVSAPAGVAAGDLLILDVDDYGENITIPSGWTAMSSNNSNPYSSPAVESTFAYRIATSADVGATYTVSFAASTQAVVRVMDYVGTASSQSQQTAGDCVTFGSGNACDDNGNNSSSISWSQVDVTSAGSLVAFAAQTNNTSGSASVTSAPTGAHARVNAATSGSTRELVGYNADLIQSATGNSESTSSSLSPSDPWGEAVFWFAPASSGQLVFGTAPALPSLPSVTLNGHSQTVTGQMPTFDIDDTTGSGSGWNVTVQGATGSGLSPVFAQYCPGGACGTAGYVASGASLPADSLALDTSGASWSTQGGSGTTPSFECNATACPLDSSSATELASAPAGGGEGPWSASGFSSSSLSLTVPTTTLALPSNEVYHVDLLFTVNSGP